MKQVIHLHKKRPNPFSKGEFTNGTLCNRMVVSDDGMNLTEKFEEVTCKLCLKRGSWCLAVTIKE